MKDELDKEEENSVRKIKRGCHKHKGKFPFKCFKCCRIGLFYESVLLRKTKALSVMKN